MRDVITLVLGGGRGTRLFPLTRFRAKPAVPLAGKYRLIDIPISNCINSGINQIYVLTQFLSVSLHRHLRQTYRFDRFSSGFVELLAAQQTDEAGTDWYQGTADAVRKNLRYLKESSARHVLILSGDQLYRMDYGRFLATHEHSGADVTISSLPVDAEAAKSLGLMRVNDEARVLGFVEKPQTKEEADPVRMDPVWIDGRGIESRGRDLLANMGIYVFNRQVLVDILEKTTFEDFGRQIFPMIVKTHHVQMHLFDDYWEDIGTIRAFYEANLSLCGARPPFDLARPEAPIYTRARTLPPTVVGEATISRSLIADGCRIGKGAVIEGSVIGLRTIIGEGAVIRDSILMGADWLETAAELEAGELAKRPPIGIGAGSVIERAIVDKNCRIGRNVRIVNEAELEEAGGDESNCLIRDGIPIAVKDALLADGFDLSQALR